MITLILCGGSGTRLWPISRQLLPKQYYPLFDEGSLFEATVKRNAPICDSFAIAANRDQAFIALDQLKKLGFEGKNGLFEPVGRNTAPAIALIAMSLQIDEIILVTPSDHLILNEDAYKAALEQAKAFASEGKIVVFGIKPTYPETGYGYIQYHGNDVVMFKEKPDSERAKAYFESGEYLWNSGMFCFKAGAFLEELRLYAPDVYSTCLAIHKELGGAALLEPSKAQMERIPSIAVDVAVMERSKNMSVVPCDIGWNDLGSFDSLYAVAFDSSKQNAILAEDDPIFIDSSHNLILAAEKKKIVLIGIQDIAVVDTPDALLLVHRGESQKVKDAVEILRRERSPLLDSHMTVNRPWGLYTILLENDRVKVKRLTVFPGKRLSLQKHMRRQEHWVCVDGLGRVNLNGGEMLLRRNEDVFISAGDVHRLECVGEDPLVVIETQIGEYFGEDDIIRLEDDYNRD